MSASSSSDLSVSDSDKATDVLPKLQKRKRDAESWYQGLPALKKQVTSGFQDETYSDFTIQCEGRSFHVHKLILESLPYFAAILKNDFVESRQGVIKLEDDDPDLLEVLLATLYGLDLEMAIARYCKRPEAPPNHKRHAMPFVIAPHEKYIPTLQLATRTGEARQESRYRRPQELAHHRFETEPTARAATHFCKEFLALVKLMIIADKCSATRIARNAESLAKNVLVDCYTSLDILDAAREVFELFPELEQSVAEELSRGLGQRTFFYVGVSDWSELIEDFPKFCQYFYRSYGYGELSPHSDDEENCRYCPRATCRTNVIQRGGKCPQCHNGGLTPAKSYSWIEGSDDDED